MKLIAMSFLILSIILFIMYFILTVTIFGVWISEIGLWLIWMPISMIITSIVLVASLDSFAGDEMNVMFLAISSILNAGTTLRIIVPFIRLSTTNRNLENAMKKGLGDDYLKYIAPNLDTEYFSKVKFKLGNYMFGFRNRELQKKVNCLKNITYHKAKDYELKLDIFYPKRNGNFPIIIFIHGGGFVLGSKNQLKNEKLCYHLANFGYTVFSIDYRLTPLKYLSKKKNIKDNLLICEMVTDIREAIIYVKDNAAKYKGNPMELFLVGRSAGGHLALLTAFSCLGKVVKMEEITGDIKEYEILGVAAFYPPTDFTSLYNHYGKQNLLKFILNRGVGGSPEEVKYLYNLFSPISYVTEKNRKSIPPVFLATGEKDRIVLPEQSKALHKQLEKHDIKNVLMTFPWANHSFDAVINGLGGQLALKYLTQFLIWVITKAKLEKIEELAKKNGLEEIVSKQKFDLVHNMPDYDPLKLDEDQYNEVLLEHLYQQYKL